MTRNSPPKLGGEPARTKSEQAGWFPCRYWQLREPPRPRLRSGTPPNLGGECPHSNSFTAPMTAATVPKPGFLCKAVGRAGIYEITCRGVCPYSVHVVS